MASAPRPRSTRDRPAKPPLSEDAIVDAALRVLRSDGLEAVTMRRVATELDTGAASLYVYIGGREALRNAMLNRVSAQLKLEKPDPRRWRDQVHAVLDSVLEALGAHPGLASVALANPPASPDSMLFAENLLGLLLAGGVGRRDAAWACDVIPLITTATAIEGDVWRARGASEEDQREWVEGLRQSFSSLPRARFPLVTGLAEELTSGDANERFHFAIDSFLDGLVARSGPQPLA